MKFIYYSTKQTAKEIKEEGLKLKRYYKVLLLLFTFILISSGVHAKGISFFHFNESLCTCSAGTGSSFNYADWFNQGLNTTSDVSFNSISLDANNYWSTADSFNVEYDHNDAEPYATDTYMYVWNNGISLGSDDGGNNYINSIDLVQNNPLGYYLGLSSQKTYSPASRTYIRLYPDKLLINTSNEIHIQLSGSGNAFACLNENGTLYRSATACN